MKSKEGWIHETMEGLDGIVKPEPNPYLFEKIKTRMENRKANFISQKFAWSLITCMILLAAINFLSCIRYEKKNTISSSSESKTFYSEYFSYINTNSF